MWTVEDSPFKGKVSKKKKKQNTEGIRKTRLYTYVLEGACIHSLWSRVNIPAATACLVNVHVFCCVILSKGGGTQSIENTYLTKPVMEICKSSLKARTFDFFKEQMGREPKAKGTLKMI